MGKIGVTGLTMDTRADGKPMEILLVEDNPGDVRFTAEVLKEALVTVGAWTPDQAYGENRTAKDALKAANAAQLVKESYPQAEMLIKRRNRGVHSDPHAGSASEERAVQSLSALGKVLEELGRSAATRVQ